MLESKRSRGGIPTSGSPFRDCRPTQRAAAEEVNAVQLTKLTNLVTAVLRTFPATHNGYPAVASRLPACDDSFSLAAAHSSLASAVPGG